MREASPANFIKIHRTLRVTLAMETGVTPRLFDVSDLCDRIKRLPSVKRARITVLAG